jgi:hypothetical protein
MNQYYPHLQPRRRFLAASVSTAALSIAGLSCKRAGSRAQSFRMGERASIGKLIYIASRTEWKTTIGDGAGARLPHDRFLFLYLTITNGGGAAIAVPLLSLYDANGKQHRELDDIENLPSWLGALRMLAPVETREGLLVFDVPVASYKLQITDAAEVENEQIAYIDVPLHLESDPVLTEPSAIAGPKV